MRNENGSGDHDDDGKRPAGDDAPDWVEKHLVKIIVGVGVLCVLGLVGRAFTG